MTGSPTIVHLIGFPASGKYTIAKALAQRAGAIGDRYVVIDNHLTSNVIFTALDVDGVRQLSPTVWGRVAEVREALYGTIEDLSPREWSFVFTNVLTDQAPDDTKIVERIASRRRDPVSMFPSRSPVGLTNSYFASRTLIGGSDSNGSILLPSGHS